jgi:glycerol-3-phosphate dehydrogenase
MLSKQAVLRVEPNLRSRDLSGGGLYYDARCNDARLTLATVRSAHSHGALTANYVNVDDLERAGGRVTGARVTDRINSASYVIHAHVVVNATGPWSDLIRRREQETPLLTRTKGVHVTVQQDRLGNKEAVTLLSPIDGRVMFIVPWGELSYIGTTDTAEESLDPDDVRATGEDVVYLLRSVNALFPRARLTPDDVISTWAGIRPLVQSSRGDSLSAMSREHKIKTGRTGLISIMGGKLTTYRDMAADVVNVVGSRLRELDGRRIPNKAQTDVEPLPGGEVADLEVLVRDVMGEGFSRDIAEHIVRSYGTETAAVVRLAQTDRRLAEPVIGGHPAIKAQIVHSLRREMAMTLTDLMMRRTHLFYEVVGHGVPEAPAVVDLASEELGWDPGRKASELAAYLKEIQRAMAFRDEVS